MPPSFFHPLCVSVSRSLSCVCVCVCSQKVKLRPCAGACVLRTCARNRVVEPQAADPPCVRHSHRPRLGTTNRTDELRRTSHASREEKQKDTARSWSRDRLLGHAHIRACAEAGRHCLCVCVRVSVPTSGRSSCCRERHASSDG